MVKKKLLLKKSLIKKIILVVGIIIFISSISYFIFKLIENNEMAKKNEDCASLAHILNTEVNQYSTNNVTDCACIYINKDLGEELQSQCICSCKLYDENGTLVDDDFNPLFSTLK